MYINTHICILIYINIYCSIFLFASSDMYIEGLCYSYYSFTCAGDSVLC